MSPISISFSEMGVVLTLAYLLYLIANATDILSPILAILFAGITMRHYAHYNLTITTRQVFLPTIELVANLCETYAFLLLGVGCSSSHWTTLGH